MIPSIDVDNFLPNLVGSMATPSLPSPPHLPFHTPSPSPFNRDPGISPPEKVLILQMFV